MGILSRFRRDGVEQRLTLNNPSVPLSSDGILAVLGSGLSTNSGVNVSEMTALTMAVVWRCVSLIASLVARCPIEDYRIGDDGSRQKVANLLLADPSDDMTAFELWETVMVHLLLWGNAFLLKVPNGFGDVVRLRPFHPWAVSVTRQIPQDSAILPTPFIGRKQYYAYGSNEPLTDDDIIHIPGLGYDGIKGLAPIAHVRQAVGVGMAAEEFGARLFGSGGMMGGILTTDERLTQDRADRIKMTWRERVSGLARAHEIAVLDGGLKYTPIAVPPEDSQFLQSRQFSVEELCRFFGVPPHLVGQIDKTTSWGAGINEQTLGFLKFTLGQWFDRIEARLTKGGAVAPGHVAKFDLSALLRGDQHARYMDYATAISGGWLTRKEVRTMEQRAGVDLTNRDDDGLDDFNLTGPDPAITNPPVATLRPTSNKED